MPTLFERYVETKQEFNQMLKKSVLIPEQIRTYQELLYRISVLESFQMFVKTAPATTNVTLLLPHYQLVDAFVQNILIERREPAAAERQKQIEMCHTSLKQVVDDYRRRFGSFAPTRDTHYQAEIRNAVSSVIPVWIQYRNTFSAPTAQKEAI